MNPNGLESTGYAFIFSNDVLERVRPILTPRITGRYRQNRMVRMEEMGQEANA
ncbi:MAG: hypothetical protein QNJ32_28170 [Xenococcaceae cyanobacterium MO_167.B27]|nr:hypothetical protein [Xenococcaceae cyanobacterium MO_167.B27]